MRRTRAPGRPSRGPLAVTAALLLGACGADVQVEVPPGLARVAIAHRGSAGWSAASGLLRSDAPGGHRAALAAEGSALVLGWTDSALTAALGALPEERVLVAEALRAPAPCEAVLPPPSWAARVGAEGVEVVDAATLPPLTAGWAAARCPDVELSTEVVCGESAGLCPLRRAVREGCSYQLDFDCELGRVVIGQGGGGACTTTPGCTAQRTAEGVVELDCVATCAVEDPTCADRPGQRAVACSASIEVTPPLALDQARVALTAEPPRTAPTRAGGEVWPETVLSGYLGTPVVVGRGADERVVVPVHGWRPDRRCSGAEATRLARVETGGEHAVRFVDGPPCLDLLARDPAGDGFLGAHGSAVPAVTRFDASGAPRLTAELTTLPPVGRRIELLTADDGTIVLVYAVSDRQAVLVVLDPATLQVREQRVLDGVDVSAAALTDDRWLVVADDLSDVVLWFDLALDECLGSVSAHVLLYPLLDLGNVPVLSLAFVQPTRALLVAVNEYPALHVYDDLCAGPLGPGETCWEDKGRCMGGLRVFPRDRGAEPIRTAPWGAQYAVASTVRASARGEGFSAALTLFDQKSDRFLPAVVPLGHGVARDLVVDLSGALWVTLPWSGELVRLRER